MVNVVILDDSETSSGIPVFILCLFSKIVSCGAGFKIVVDILVFPFPLQCTPLTFLSCLHDFSDHLLLPGGEGG